MPRPGARGELRQPSLFGSVECVRPWAEFSPCLSHGPLCAAPACDGRRFRFVLGREWGHGPRVSGILLNPSKASAETDDPTLRKFIGFAKRLGAGSCEIGNPFNLRATDPRDLKSWLRDGLDCVGKPRADEVILEIAARADTLIVGWGANGAHHLLAPRIREVLCLLGNRPLWCFGVTADGCPQHPLMLGYSTPLIPFAGGVR
jgi:hypothetical protein